MRGLRTFATKLLLFLAPFFALLLVQQFVLPPDYFCFRCWEAMSPSWRVARFMPGPFYPLTRMQKTEQGDLAYYTPYAVKKEVVWQTDRYGFRNQDDSNPVFDVVIVGDSNGVGTGLTQSETLSEVLARESGLRVYTYASSNNAVVPFLAEKRFRDAPPRIVVLQCVERMIGSLNAGVASAEVREHPLYGAATVSLLRGIDRCAKMPVFHYSRARTRELLRDGIDTMLGKSTNESALPYGSVWANDRSMIFIHGSGYRELGPGEVERAAQNIVTLRQLIEARGSRFIFLPIPEKANVYHAKFGDGRKPVYLPALQQRLKELGVPFVPMQEAFENARESAPELLFLFDDTHWSPRGVQVAVDALIPMLK